jgi:hypothetical protein
MRLSRSCRDPSVGLAFSFEESIAPHVASGALVRVLEGCASRFRVLPHCPGRRRQPAALSV